MYCVSLGQNTIIGSRTRQAALLTRSRRRRSGDAPWVPSATFCSATIGRECKGGVGGGGGGGVGGGVMGRGGGGGRRSGGCCHGGTDQRDCDCLMLFVLRLGPRIVK